MQKSLAVVKPLLSACIASLALVSSVASEIAPLTADVADRAAALCAARADDERALGSLGPDQMAFVRLVDANWVVDAEMRTRLGSRWLPYGDSLLCVRELRQVDGGDRYSTATWHILHLQGGQWSEEMFTTVVERGSDASNDLFERLVVWLDDEARGGDPKIVAADRATRDANAVAGDRKRDHMFAGRFRADRLAAEPPADGAQGGRDRGGRDDRGTSGRATRTRASSPDGASAVEILESVKPVYPPDAKAQRLGGVVKLAATIGVDGRAHDIEVVSGDPKLAVAAVEALAKWRFRPAEQAGEPTPVRYETTFNFTAR